MEWISVKDRLPQFDVHVIVWCRIYGMFIATYEEVGFGFGNWRHNDELGILPPLYWMPLPEPPKEL